ncbi:hypothetical protein CXP54_22325 [Escherichia albertii]|uniref:DUF2857 domain-containing protein n=1 Tax=Escherichia albertii TaxID=208962 RepID=UPI000C9ECD01|nr:DUF2857 domain-containing protein [Escherichia albertii]AUS68071.1 hypothetical protein CXP54_22325 [Escherichia albertii]EAB1453793.1 DUF2857 domain-containing protein [Escherichia albertii]EEW7340277.1 DUF2857 domain-containing protein [Escherichia albertii]EJY9800278.1 DUF2857 domain-containing protein [Escherichia albertii]MCU7326361.1 DUF2857 domain-containing protein [Escherichia albertii]
MNALLTQIVMELKSGNIRRCEAMGLTLEEIQELNSLTVEDLHYLVNTPVSLLTFRINHTNLNTMLAQARREQTRTQRIDRALTLSGSIELMQHFFGLTATEVSARRRLVGVVTRQGRSQIPTEEQELAVWQQWKASNVDNLESLDALEAMMLIAEQQDISLTAVWTLTKGWSAA